MLRIYSTLESLYCSKLRILLQHKQAKWQEINPEGGCGSAQYRDMIPTGTMPALVDGDLVLADSEAIAEYLNERLPDPAMLPASLIARAKCRERSRFHDTRFEPEIRALFPHIGQSQIGSEVSTIQSEKLSLRLQQLSRLLESDNTLDPGFLSLGDCGFPISFAWLDAFTPVMGLEIEWPRGVRNYREQIQTHAAVSKVLTDCRPAIERWMRSKGV
jgi:glutathione S-transferase